MYWANLIPAGRVDLQTGTSEYKLALTAQGEGNIAIIESLMDELIQGFLPSCGCQPMQATEMSAVAYTLLKKIYNVKNIFDVK